MHRVEIKIDGQLVWGGSTEKRPDNEQEMLEFLEDIIKCLKAPKTTWFKVEPRSEEELKKLRTTEAELYREYKERNLKNDKALLENMEIIGNK